MQVSKPAVQYVTFVMGNITAEPAKPSATKRLPPKTIQPNRSGLPIDFDLAHAGASPLIGYIHRPAPTAANQHAGDEAERQREPWSSGRGRSHLFPHAL